MYCVITHRISMSLHVILCLSRSEASCIVFYTQHCREWACHMVFVTIRSLVYCFFTPDCREFACHSVFVTTRSVVCCLLHRIGWTWPVIMCACHNQKPRVFFFQQDCQELEFHSVEPRGLQKDDPAGKRRSGYTLLGVQAPGNHSHRLLHDTQNIAPGSTPYRDRCGARSPTVRLERRSTSW